MTIEELNHVVINCIKAENQFRRDGLHRLAHEMYRRANHYSLELQTKLSLECWG